MTDDYDYDDAPATPKKPGKKAEKINAAARAQTGKTSEVPKQTAVTNKTRTAEDRKKPAERLVTSLSDPRKLTQKGTASLRQQWSAQNAPGSRDVLMQSLLDVAQNEFGADRVFGSREALEKLIIGIPVPSLAFEWLIANDVFPLGIVMMIAGPWGSCKSALLYEIFRWFYEQNGINVHVDTEDKFDARFACDIMRAPHDVLPLISNKAESTEQAQEIMTHYVDQIKAKLTGTKESPGPGKTVPVCFAQDSVAGSQSAEVQEKILKEGSANRSHPVGALKNSIYLPVIRKELQNYPFALVFINHLKQKTDENGHAHNYTLGGQAFNFLESFELQNSIWRSRFQNSQFEGLGVRLRCTKNSFGPTGRVIQTRFLSWLEEDPATGKSRNVHLWDWNWALCTLLNELEGIPKKRLQDRGLTIKCKSPKADVDCLANFRAIGMGPEEYLPFQEVGQLIQEDAKVCQQLREALNIRQRYLLDRPYDEIVEGYKNNVE